MADMMDAEDIAMDSATSSSSSSSEMRCDESRCLSTGLMPADESDSAAVNNPLLFNCYAQGPGTLYPYLCADDYVGVRIEDEVAASASDLHYYTCCPPDESGTILPARECLDPQQADPVEANSNDWTPTTACQTNSPSFPYGREMTEVPGFPLAYMCCNVDTSGSPSVSGVEEDTVPTMAQDTIIDDSSGEDVPASSTNSSQTGEVIGEGDGVDVPAATIPVEEPTDSVEGGTEFSSAFVHPVKVEEISSSNNILDSAQEESVCQSFPCHDCLVENNFWDLETMNCFNDFYRYPEVVSVSGNTATYRCCSVPPQDGVDSSFLVTAPAYRATVWTQFTLALIASLMASLLIASIGRSLYLTTKKKNSSSNTNQRRNSNPDYSAYNLYLIFLAIPDLAYNLFMLGIVTEEFFNGWIPENDALITISATTNQYMNAIIAKEVLDLLRNTKECKRYTPPSFKKAGIQFACVTAYATALGVVWLYLLHYSFGTNGVRATKAIPAEEYSIPIFYLLVVIIPGVYLIWVCFEIWHKKLLPKGSVTIGENLRRGPRDITRNTEETSQPPSLKNLLDKEVWVSFRKALSDRFINNDSDRPPCDDPRDNTNTTTNPAPSKRYSHTTHTDVTAVNSDARPLGPSSDHDTIPSTTILPSNHGRLNVLAVYFLRVILVFFFLWLPGMIMYYIGYETDRNASGLLHNAGLIFFSLQAIVSNGIAFTKPDVKKSIHDLWEEIAKLCPCCQRPKEEGRDPTAPPETVSPGKAPEKWPERDIEMPIREEPSSSFFSRDNSNPSSSRVVSVNHKVANIGGIQVTQLTTHTISSFHSSSHRNRLDEDSDNESDTENNEYLEFAIPSPRITRNSKVLVPGTSSHSRGEKDSKSEKKEKKKPKRSSGSSSRRSNQVGRSLQDGSSNSGSLSTSSKSTSKRKMKKRISSSESSDPTFEPGARRSFKGSKSPIGSRKKRISGSSVPGGDSPAGQWTNVISSVDVHLGKSPSLDAHLEKSPIGSRKQRRVSSSDLQKRRSHSGKMLYGNDNDRSKSPGARPAHRRGSGSHLCKLNASNSPISQMTLNSNANGSHTSKSPVPRRKHRRSSDTDIPIARSPVGERKKKLHGSDSHLSMSPIRSEQAKKSIANISIANKSPIAQLKKKIDNGYGPPKRKNSGTSSSHSSKSPSRRRVSTSDKNGGDIPSGPPKRKNSRTSSNKSNNSARRLSSSDKKIVEALIEESNKNIGGNIIDDARKSPGQLTKKRLSSSSKNVSDESTGESKKKNSSATNGDARKSPGYLSKKRLSSSGKNFGVAPFPAKKPPSYSSKSRTNGSEKNVGEPPLGQQKKRTFRSGHISKLSMAQPIEKRTSSTNQVSDSSATTNGRTRGISNSKSLSFDGTVTDNSLPSS